MEGLFEDAVFQLYPIGFFLLFGIAQRDSRLILIGGVCVSFVLYHVHSNYYNVSLKKIADGGREGRCKRFRADAILDVSWYTQGNNQYRS
jgi:hypothetical protein